MYFDLMLGPHFAARRGKGLRIWDNCGPHGVKAVEERATARGIKLAPLPKNMTDKLQEMDLVANGPFKYGMRRERTSQIFDYFQSWKIKRLQELAKPEDERVLPPFSARPSLPRLQVCSWH